MFAVLGLVLLKLNVVEVNVSVTHSQNIALEQGWDNSLADIERHLQAFKADTHVLAGYLRPMGKTIADFEGALTMSIVADENTYAIKFASPEVLDPYRPGMVNFGKQFEAYLLSNHEAITD
ncbi:hypothetical protein [Alkalimonas sp.]|uniref:hypothetical protein n=1 Tax=Alkalimonas sp. TaxID=1872453 RepID=UPI00263AA17D|nr:hypothetical protein [Alkalimonas sp.]MCC5825167.1 hypothetical protein [Alkalimonas sp.]